MLRGFDLFYSAGVVAAFILGYTIRGIVERVRQQKLLRSNDADSNIR